MNIQYANAHVFAIPSAVSYLKGTLNDLGNGNYSVTQANGKFLSIQHDGSYQDRDAVGPWETFAIDSGAPLLRVHVSEAGVSIPYAIAFRAA